MTFHSQLFLESHKIPWFQSPPSSLHHSHRCHPWKSPDFPEASHRPSARAGCFPGTSESTPCSGRSHHRLAPTPPGEAKLSRPESKELPLIQRWMITKSCATPTISSTTGCWIIHDPSPTRASQIFLVLCLEWSWLMALGLPQCFFRKLNMTTTNSQLFGRRSHWGHERSWENHGENMAKPYAVHEIDTSKAWRKHLIFHLRIYKEELEKTGTMQPWFSTVLDLVMNWGPIGEMFDIY